VIHVLFEGARECTRAITRSTTPSLWRSRVLSCKPTTPPVIVEACSSKRTSGVLEAAPGCPLPAASVRDWFRPSGIPVDCATWGRSTRASEHNIPFPAQPVSTHSERQIFADLTDRVIVILLKRAHQHRGHDEDCMAVDRDNDHPPCPALRLAGVRKRGFSLTSAHLFKYELVVDSDLRGQ